MLVIVLLFSSSSTLLARTDASKGEIQGDSVSLPISLIRKANIKLIQAESDVELKYNEDSTEEPTKEIVFKKMAN